jgi:ankyrin repeat protein
MIAAEYGRADAVEVLLATGASASARDEKGNTAMTFCIGKNQEADAHWLLGSGIGITLTGNSIETAEQIANGRNYPRIVHLLSAELNYVKER